MLVYSYIYLYGVEMWKKTTTLLKQVKVVIKPATDT